MNDITAVFHACKTMYLAKYKPKSFVYQRREETEAFYLILNGKIGIYERNRTETVIVLSEGNCFGHIYSWKVDLLPLTFDEVLLAVMPK